MEHRVPDALFRAEHRNKPTCQKRRTHTLDHKRTDQKLTEGRHNAAHLKRTRALENEPPLVQTDLPLNKKGDHCEQGHKSDTADLNEHQNDSMSEGRPIGGGGLYHKSRHAGRRGGGKECVHRICPFSRRRRKRQAKQQRAEQNHGKKTDRDQLCVFQLQLRKPTLFHATSLPSHFSKANKLPVFYYTPKKHLSQEETQKKEAPPIAILPISYQKFFHNNELFFANSKYRPKNESTANEILEKNPFFVGNEY